MKTVSAILCLLFINISLSYSQINYQKTYEEATKQAAAHKQQIFISIMPRIDGNFPGFKSALDNKDVADFYNENFVNYTVSVHDTYSLPLRLSE